jgi:uncharacterized protein
MHNVGRYIALGLLVIALLAGGVITGQAQDTAQTVMVPMPDGVKLATSLYLPDGDGPWPVLLVRTPYNRASLDMGPDLAAAGIVAVAQDVRGQYDSEGEPAGFFSAREDGQTTLDWIAAQPWSNGRVATFGGSALGIAQYMLAPGAPDNLRCQWIEVATPDVYHDAAFQGGVWRSELVERWLQGNNSDHLVAPFKAHPLNTAYWDPVQITGQFDAVHIPAVHVAGWYDIFARGTIDGFLGYQNEGGAGAAGQQHLIMGPWTHSINNDQIGAFTIPAAVTEDYNRWVLHWLQQCLLAENDGPPDLGEIPTVTYFTLGAVSEDDAPGNVWRTAESWPPTTNAVPVYLQPNGYLSVEPPGADGGGDTFAYDPTDPAPTIGGANLTLAAGPFDQRPIERREDVVVYSTPPLEDPVEVTGDLRAEVWISTDVPDTDILVRVTDVYPDGRSMLVAEGILRARYHNHPDFTDFQLLEPDTPVRLDIDLGPTSIVFNQGHRVRVSITSSSVPRFAPNPNTGDMFLAEGDSGQIAHTTILHSADYPSAVILPVP